MIMRPFHLLFLPSALLLATEFLYVLSAPISRGSLSSLQLSFLDQTEVWALASSLISESHYLALEVTTVLDVKLLAS